MFDYTKTAQAGIDDQLLSPHPDGQAWPKCCRDLPLNHGKISCAFVRDQDFGQRLSSKSGPRVVRYCNRDSSEAPVAEKPFMCVHRTTEDGHHRVCAGWDACFGNKAIAARSK